MDGKIKFEYQNYRAELELRTIQALSLDYLPVPNNQMGYPPGWALRGLDFSRGRNGGEERSFYLSHIQLPEVLFRQPNNAHPYRIMLPSGVFHNP